MIYRFLILWIIIYCSACDSMMQPIDVEPANLPPMLAVTATLDTKNGGAFSFSMTEGRSIGSYKNGQPDTVTIIRNGTITLYEDDRVMYRLSDKFDMSLRMGDKSGYVMDSANIATEPLKAGSIYRLVFDIEGYPRAEASAVMPDAPKIEHVELDRKQIVVKKHPYSVYPFGHSGGRSSEESFFPLTVRLTDNSANRNYYLLRLYNTNSMDDYTEAYSEWLGVSNRVLIQDNPDLEIGEFLLEYETDVFMFNRLVLSDVSFMNSTGVLDLLVPKSVAYDYGPPPCSNPQQIVRAEFSVSHLSPEAYSYYRSLTLQNRGVSFFTEPVSIISNFKNAYGCFSVCNTVRYVLSEAHFCETYGH